jgi:TRAP-type mannitol/chloroaromatic compound transport system permease small subunit
MRKYLIRIIELLLQAAGMIATTLLLLLVAVVAYNVVARYFFSASSIGLEELGWHLYATVFLLAIPYAVYTDSHVRIDLIYEGRSPRYKKQVGIAGAILFMMPFALVTFYYGVDFTAQAFAYGTHADTLPGLWEQFFTDGIGEKSQDPGGLNNRFVVKSVIPVSALLLFLAGIRNLLQLTDTNVQQPEPTVD